MLDNFRNIDIHWKNAHDRIQDVRTALHDEKGRKLVVQVGDDEDTTGVDLILRADSGLWGDEVGGRNYFRLSNVVNFAIRGSVVSGEIIGSSDYKSFYTPVKKDEVWSLSRTEIGNANRFGYTFSTDEPIFGVEVSGGVDHRNDLKVEGIKIPFDGWLYIYLANNVSDAESLPNIKLEKGNKATDWTPAPEDMQFKFNQLNNQGLYELYIPKDLPNKEVFLELTHDDFKITSEPFKIDLFKGVK